MCESEHFRLHELTPTQLTIDNNTVNAAANRRKCFHELTLTLVQNKNYRTVVFAFSQSNTN